jgi:anti-sigma-K factor RskA
MTPPPPEFDEHTQERAALHALGMLTVDESTDFEREMWTRPGLRELVQEMRIGLEQVARAESLKVPPPRLRDTLLEQVSSRPASNPPLAFPAFIPEIAPAPTRLPFNIVWLPWAAAAVFALLCAVFFFQRNSARADARIANAKMNDATNELRLATMQTSGLNKRLVDLEAETARLRAESARLAQNQAASWGKLRVAALRTTPSANPASTAGALVIWDADQGVGMLNVRNLPPAPAGKDYQLWVIDPSRPNPYSGGVFKTSADGSAQITFRPSPTGKVRADKFAISLEPEGGRPVPEGQIFMAGS